MVNGTVSCHSRWVSKSTKPRSKKDSFSWWNRPVTTMWPMSVGTNTGAGWQLLWDAKPPIKKHKETKGPYSFLSKRNASGAFSDSLNMYFQRSSLFGEMGLVWVVDVYGVKPKRRA